ncbi:hypothetical protein B7755_043740 [Streptomyces sp. NBS 14/10]|uniref:hypothetical protein n=1 Tax=Streptomyces sp. NBS 14/10 TaxID=1945643 RepID=UPI000B7D3DB8|nr:hypothetical protein [Streptomyces sp. NBS 14/10]KAK1184410.1 hypothetical protein B7755_043740 [Streptomyces sp. NBS 14/10]
MRLVSDVPVHVDIHPIPAKGEAPHTHVDFRYVFTTDVEDITRLQVEEVADACWLPVGQIVSAGRRDQLAAALTQRLYPNATGCRAVRRLMSPG